MSLCQPGDLVSAGSALGCGGCCGLRNLRIPPAASRELLTDRTDEINRLLAAHRDTRRFFPAALAWRQARERLEAELEREDPTTYVCPFLGWLAPTASGAGGAIGCLIHPLRTGLERSQNASFYGQSICQAYDCKNKETPQVDFWTRQFAHAAADSYEYSLLCADYALRHYLERYLPGGEAPQGWNRRQCRLVRYILRRRLDPRHTRREISALTSFEIIEQLTECSPDRALDELSRHLAPPDELALTSWRVVLRRVEKLFL